MRDFIFVSLENWDEIWRRNQFLCAEFMRENPGRQMLFVGLAKDVSHCLRHGKWAQLQAPGCYRLPDFPGITVLHPLKFLPNSWPPARRLNEIFTRWQVRRASRRLGLDRPILWLNAHTAVHMAGQMGESAVIYDITDDWTELEQHDWQARLIREQDEELCRRADAVIVCSERLRQIKEGPACQPFLIPNGVDAAHYQRVLDGTGPLPEAAAAWRGPVIGYTGTIHPDRVDLPLLRELALTMPDETFVLIGPVMLPGADEQELRALPNLVLTGPIPYRDLPDYMRAFDVCMVPHRVTPFTESLNPIKLWDYLAAGKPIVSTPVAGFRDFPQWVRLAGDAQAFAGEIAASLREDSALPAARRAEAARHSWASRWQSVRRVIEDCLSARDETKPRLVNLPPQESPDAGLLSLLRTDAHLLTREFRGRWWRYLVALGNSGFQAVLCYRLAHWLWRCRVPILPAILNRVSQHLYAVDIAPSARIGPGLVLVHCFGTVIGTEVRIAGDCIIYHGVTLGNRGSEWVGSARTDGHPQIGPGCIFGAGAKVLGSIRLGRNSVVGANSVVLESMPPDSVIAGIPARVVARRPEMDENLRPLPPRPATERATA